MNNIMKNTFITTTNNSSNNNNIEQNDMVFTSNDAKLYPRTTEIMQQLEHPQYSIEQIYQQKTWNISYFFERKR